jgi:archaellum biogenesis protein FlaJ (TadC family)
MYIFALIFIAFFIMSIFQLIYPRKAFMRGKRWQFKGDFEPSNLSIIFTRLSAIVVILIIVLMFYMFFFYKPF